MCAVESASLREAGLAGISGSTYSYTGAGGLGCSRLGAGGQLRLHNVWMKRLLVRIEWIRSSRCKAGLMIEKQRRSSKNSGPSAAT